MRLTVFDSLVPSEDVAFVTAKLNPRVSNRFVRIIGAEHQWNIKRVMLGVALAHKESCPRWALHVHGMFACHGYVRPGFTEEWTLEQARNNARDKEIDDYTMGLVQNVFFTWPVDITVDHGMNFDVRLPPSDFFVRVVLDGELRRKV